MINNTLEISGDSDLLNACFAALEPEKEFKTERATYTLKLDKSLKIDIIAKDITAFRAVMNSITGLLGIVDQNWRIIK